ncbi:hypothetical protein [Paraburkholderia atlantica]|uniref:hypothetical protein n=1 Tax=Paraburkholderia atlantica TaxID=2654982 RepID=UPI001611ADC4|nr:hypothetical protein [Paraburkholderia atlantica]MBB5507785.1 hypothetical protein [Paraburkholderia atlantica]
MNDQDAGTDIAAFIPRLKRGLQASAIVISIAAALTACGGGGSDSAGESAVAHKAAPPAASASPHVVPLNARFRGKTYAQWEASFWQWALALPLGPLPHPFNDCTNRPISAGQTGNVWYWSAPDLPDQICNQSANVIPAGTAIFLTTLDVEASSLDPEPFYAATAAGQRAIAHQFANYIQNVFVSVDDVPIANVSAYRTMTDQFPFTAPTPWVFDPTGTGGNGTAVGDGYFLLLEPLSAGSHKIHYGGNIHIPAGVLGPDPVDIPKDVTLLITVGSSR